MSSSPPESRGATTRMLLLWAALTICAVWALWRPTLVEMTQRWAEDPTYSHGFLMPLFSLGLLWYNRREIAAIKPSPTWWGVVLVLAGALLQSAGSYLYIRWLQGAALLAYLAGGALVAGGWPLLRHAWTAVAFLTFMIPLPYRVEDAMRSPLQRVATTSSTFLLQLVGLPAVAQGNVIDVDGHQLGVAEACSGLKMLITFVALAVGLVLVIKRPAIDKAIILLSALPIAIISNVIRITVTGILYVTVGEKTAEFVYHDLAGYLMMPLGVALMWLEMKVLEYLFVERAPEDPARLRPLILGADLGLPVIGGPQPPGKPKPGPLGDL